MSKYIKFNINNYVRVKLNDLGLQILAKYWGGIIPEWYSNYIDNDGYYSFQMHVLMSIFGKDMINGFYPPFETNIFIEVDDE